MLYEEKSTTYVRDNISYVWDKNDALAYDIMTYILKSLKFNISILPSVIFILILMQPLYRHLMELLNEKFTSTWYKI